MFRRQVYSCDNKFALEIAPVKNARRKLCYPPFETLTGLLSPNSLFKTMPNTVQPQDARGRVGCAMAFQRIDVHHISIL